MEKAATSYLPSWLHWLLEAFPKYSSFQESLWRLLQHTAFVTNNLFFDNDEKISIYCIM